MAPKLEDHGAFTIPYTIRSADFAKSLCDFGASINLMPYSIFKTLGIGKPRPTYMRLQMADRTMKRPLGVIEDILVRVDKFIFLVDFVIIDCEVDYEEPIIIERPFLTTGKALCDVKAGELTFWVGDEKVVFHMCKSMRQPNSNEVCSFVDLVTDIIVDDISVLINIGDMLEAISLNFNDDEMDGFMECVNSLQGMGSYTYAPRKLSLDLENRKIPPTKPYIEEPPTLELKSLPPYLWYEFLGLCSTLPVILSSFLTNMQRIPFGLCNTPATFQWCMMDIFMDIVEDYLEVFVDDFPVVGDSFDDCFANLDKVLARCEETNLELNWEKCYFMVEEGIVLIHKISNNGIEVDKAKIELLDKDAKFFFNDNCMRAFEQLKLMFTAIPIITTPNWSLPFELMCDASDFRRYLMGAKVIIHTDHMAIRDLMSKKESKARLMRWVLLFQEFDIDIQDKKGSKNQVADHLSRLEEEGRPHDGLEINDYFPDEQLLALSMKEVSWFAD
ncbi:uncharacterized protein [Nicotiana tomentosiformis]|uniref:uncharacterized protein n=1 Tax=Nicotiana tomentosiformis TaxID=4098 RepID=UPI00388C7FA6